MLKSVHFTVDLGGDGLTAPMQTMADWYLDEIQKALSKGRPVTLVYVGKPLTTFWPDGRIERHPHPLSPFGA